MKQGGGKVAREKKTYNFFFLSHKVQEENNYNSTS